MSESGEIDPIEAIDHLIRQREKLRKEIDELNEKQDRIQDNIYYDKDVYDEWAQLEREVASLERHAGEIGQRIINIINANLEDPRIQERLNDDAIKIQTWTEQFNKRKEEALKLFKEFRKKALEENERNNRNDTL